jgi:hypothetical protein
MFVNINVICLLYIFELLNSFTSPSENQRKLISKSSKYLCSEIYAQFYIEFVNEKIRAKYLEYNLQYK